MDDTFFIKTGFGSLKPSNEAAEEVMKSLKTNQVVKGKITRPRNIISHNRFFAMLGLIFKNQEHYTSQNHLLFVVKQGIGHGDWIKSKLLGDIFIPASINFASMDQTAFEDFYKKAVAFILQDIMPGLDSEELEYEVLEILR